MSVPAPPPYLALHVPAELYPEALEWLARRMQQGSDSATTARGDEPLVPLFRELFAKPHKATTRVADLARAMLAGDPAEWWTSTRIRDLLVLDQYEFRSTWRALTRHLDKHYPGTPQPFQRDNGLAHSLGDTTVYRIAPDLVGVVRSALT
ncbi:hypothetical protein FHR75_004368 [Kineococcus radiotolerans]|uniref:Uncharacterized protein n=1 Tax=Kineococcus radiotolerans TaxID=131568 RepID=A0A7W4XYV0_KINRA|nr:hypothetical protein [Kineococcus radiotolerans]MBB2903526.1 hypothetical protein [Kineococcus radiotolerans]